MRRTSRSIRARTVVVALALGLAGPRAEAAIVSGQVTKSSGGAVAGARLTLFTPDLLFFREARSDASGNYQFGSVPDGAYRLGVAARGYAYQEVAVTVSGGNVARSFVLSAELEPGRWTVVGNTAPEYLEGTGWGTLMHTGEIFICHDSNDPVLFDTVSQTRWFPGPSNVEQGCHLETLLTSGDILIAGGSTEGLPQVNVVKTTKTFRRNTGTWPFLTDLNEGRWYPGGVRLPDERLLAIGGEAQPDGYGRTDTCEIYDPIANTWTYTGSFDLPTEMPPTVLLMNGEVFKTWRYPELYTIGTGTWRAAANMVQARLGAPGGDHSDHEILYLPDGRVMAVGIDPAAGVVNPSMVEFYAVAANQWTKGPTPQHLRRAPECALLPDGRVLTFGGTYTGISPGSLTLKNAGTVPNCTNVADLFDPATNAWRPVAPAGRWMHYHSVTVLAPDGRVFSTGGAGTGTSRTFGDDPSIEAYEPPYLFRGVRPRIDSVSTTDLSRGETFTMNVSLTSAVTQVLLLGMRSASHWIDLGPQRSLSLPFSQNGAQVQATVPNDAVQALAGWYLLFAMVDDIPSEARIVRVTYGSAPAPIPSLPTVTVAATDPGASEPGGNAGAFTVARTGSTAAPMTFFYTLSGTATAGADYGAVPGIVTIPAGSSSATVPVAPLDDALVEGTETVVLTLSPRVHYAVGAPGSDTVAIVDNDTGPAPDTDGDGLSDADETGVYGTNPSNPDTDGDGMSDGFEVQNGFNPLSSDQDADGVTDGLDDWDGDGTINQNDTSPGTAPAPGGGGSGGGGSGCGLVGLEALLLLALVRRRVK